MTTTATTTTTKTTTTKNNHNDDDDNNDKNNDNNNDDDYDNNNNDCDDNDKNKDNNNDDDNDSSPAGNEDINPILHTERTNASYEIGLQSKATRRPCSGRGRPWVAVGESTRRPPTSTVHGRPPVPGTLPAASLSHAGGHLSHRQPTSIRRSPPLSLSTFSISFEIKWKRRRRLSVLCDVSPAHVIIRLSLMTRRNQAVPPNVVLLPQHRPAAFSIVMSRSLNVKRRNVSLDRALYSGFYS